MKLRCLGSSSSGNCYLLENEMEILVIEAGISFNAFKKAIDFKLKKVVGVLVSHRHGDHSKYVVDFLKCGISVLAHEDVFKAKGATSSLCKSVEHQKAYHIGSFKVMPFDLQHDVPCFGFVITHSETGKILFCTDTSEIPYDFKGMNNILIEANYSDDIIYNNVMEGRLNARHQERVKKSHMSLEKSILFLESTDLSEVNNIILLHLSSQNSDVKLFKDTVEERICKKVHIADKRLNMEFNRTPF